MKNKYDVHALCVEVFSKISATVTHEIKNTLSIINENAGLLNDFTMMAGEEGGVPSGQVDSATATIAKQVYFANVLTIISSWPGISLHTASTFSPLRPENVTASPTSFPLHAANASGGGPGRLSESFEAVALILIMAINVTNAANDEIFTIRVFFILILRLFLLWKWNTSFPAINGGRRGQLLELDEDKYLATLKGINLI